MTPFGCWLLRSIPIELLLKERRATYLLKRNESFCYGSINYEPTSTLIDAQTISEKIKEIKNITIDTWQREWDSLTKGRIIHEFFGDIRDRLSAKWINLDFYGNQLLTGHGKISIFGHPHHPVIRYL